MVLSIGSPLRNSIQKGGFQSLAEVLPSITMLKAIRVLNAIAPEVTSAAMKHLLESQVTVIEFQSLATSGGSSGRITCLAVSYTHLDVYKRQPVWFRSRTDV